MNKIYIVLIMITLLTATTLTHANEAVVEDKIEYSTNEHERINNEHEVKKEKRKRLEDVAKIRRQYMALMYMWVTNKRQ